MLNKTKIAKGLKNLNVRNLTVFLPLSIAVLSSLSFTTTSKSASNSPPPQQTKVSISQIIDHPALNESRRGIIDGLKEAGYIQGENLILNVEIAQGKPAVSMQIAQKFAGEKPDVMVGMGTTSSQGLAFAGKAQKIPVVFASVTDPLDAKLVASIKYPGRPVTGVSNFTDLKPQFELFKKLVPKLRRLGIVYNPGEANSRAMMDKSVEVGKSMGIEIVPSPALKTADVSSATRNLMDKVEAVFINNDNTALAAFETVVKVADASKIPVFSSDTDLVKRGALASLGPNQYDLGLQAAKTIVRILKGEDPSTISVQFAQKLETVVNKKKADQLGVKL